MNAGGYSTTYLFPNEKQAKQGVREYGTDYMSVTRSGLHRNDDWEGEIHSAENKACSGRKTSDDMSTTEQSLNKWRGMKHIIKKSIGDLTKPFKYDGPIMVM